MDINGRVIDVRPSRFGYKAYTTNYSSASYSLTNAEMTDRIAARAIQPASVSIGNGLIPIVGVRPNINPRLLIPQTFIILPYGSGSATQTFSVRLWAFIPGFGTEVYQAIPLAELTCTLCTLTGVAGGDLGTGNKYVDTIALSSGYNSNVTVEVVSPTGNIPAYVTLTSRGLWDLFVDLKKVTATDCNALVSEF